MKKQNKFLTISIPLMIILAAAVIHDYGIVGIHEKEISINDFKMIKIKTLQKYRETIAQKSNLEKQIPILKETRKNENAKIMAAPTLAIATANLQDSIKIIIAGRGGTINSERVEKPEDLGTFKISSAVLDVVFPDVKALSDTLYAIETQTPYLVVKELDIRVRNYTDPKDLIVKLKISALTSKE